MCVLLSIQMQHKKKTKTHAMVCILFHLLYFDFNVTSQVIYMWLVLPMPINDNRHQQVGSLL